MSTVIVADRKSGIFCRQLDETVIPTTCGNYGGWLSSLRLPPSCSQGELQHSSMSYSDTP